MGQVISSYDQIQRLIQASAPAARNGIVRNEAGTAWEFGPLARTDLANTFTVSGAAAIATTAGWFQSASGNNGGFMFQGGAIGFYSPNTNRVALYGASLEPGSGSHDLGLSAAPWKDLYVKRGNFTNDAAASVVLTVKAAPSQSANLTEWQWSDGTLIGFVTGYVASGGADDGSKSAMLTLYGADTTRQSVLRLRQGATTWGYDLDIEQISQGRLDLYKVVAGTRTIALSVDRASACIGVNALAPNGTIQFFLNVSSATTIGHVIKAAPSQSANLMEWQNSSGVVLDNVEANGLVVFRGGAASTTSLFGAFPSSVAIASGYGSAQSKMLIGDGSGWHFYFSSGTAASSTNLLDISDTLASPRFTIIGNTTSNTAKALLRLRDPDDVGVAQSRLVDFNISRWQTPDLNAYTQLDIKLAHTGVDVTDATVITLRSNGNVGINTISPGAQLQVTAGSSSAIGQIIKAAPSQTANLTEWQNSAGTVLASIPAAGDAIILANGGAYVSGSGGYWQAGSIQSIYYFGLNYWHVTGGTFGTLNAIRTGTLGVASSQFHVLCPTTTKIGIIVQGAASQTANLTEWQKSDGTVNGYVKDTGNAKFGLLELGTWRATANYAFVGRSDFDQSLITTYTLLTDSDGNTSLNCVGSTRSLQFRKSNSVMAGFDGNGVFTIGNGGVAFGGGILNVVAPNSSYNVCVFRGAASRTFPLVQLQSSAGDSLGTVGGCIFNDFTDTSSTSTDGTENDLYTHTLAANTFAINGDSVESWEHVQFVSSATAARRLKKYFAGTLIFDSGALTLTLGGDFFLETKVIRESSTVVRITVNVVTTSASSVPYATYTRITGLTLTGTNILKTTGAASGAGAASGDIIDKMQKVFCYPAA